MGSQGGMLQAGASEERGENARMSSFVGALAIADLVKSTLGPKGMVGVCARRRLGGGGGGAYLLAQPRSHLFACP